MSKIGERSFFPPQHIEARIEKRLNLLRDGLFNKFFMNDKM